MNTTETPKDRSYTVRDELADLLGKGPNQDFYVGKGGHLVIVEVDGVEVDAFLLATSNAGFSGILGHFQFADGSTRMVSLGYVTQTAA